MNQQLHFLTYMARSGSTLLARELDALKETAVSIEEDIPDGIVKGEKVKLGTERELDQYLEKIYREKKLQAWNVSRDALKEKLLGNQTFPIYYDSVLKALLELYFDNDTSSRIIHKKGSYYREISQVRKLFPESKIIHLNRDPRAIYNSQKKNRDSITGTYMASSILTFCFQYQHARKLVNRHKASGYLLEIRYEDLVDHSEKEIKRILRFIGVENTQNSNKNEYYSKIPQHQRYLHENISQGLLPERKDAWKDELTTSEIFFLEKALKREMKKAGYLPVNVDFRAVERKWFVVYQLMIFYIKQGLKAYFPDFYDHLKRLSLKGIFWA